MLGLLRPLRKDNPYNCVWLKKNKDQRPGLQVKGLVKSLSVGKGGKVLFKGFLGLLL